MDNIYAIDLNLKMDWILKDVEHFSKLKYDQNKFNHFHLHENNISEFFLSWLDKFNLFIRYSEIFYTAPKGNVIIHSDHLDPPDSCKINWVYDNGRTLMQWYKVKEGKELKLMHNNIGGLYYSCESDSDYILDYEHPIKKGTLVNVAAPHGVSNLSDFPRWCVSIVPQQKNSTTRLGFSQAKELFKEFIIST